MREFFDTSVLIAAFVRPHPHHDRSLKRFAAAEISRSGCALHTMAEVFTSLTALPLRPKIPPEQALLFVDDMRSRLTFTSLTNEESYTALTHAANQGITSGRLYDLLILTCAAKAGAEVIFTWNLKHFQSLAPQIAHMVQTP